MGFPFAQNGPPDAKRDGAWETSTYIGKVGQLRGLGCGKKHSASAERSVSGPVPSVVLGGLATLIVVAVTAVKVPELRRLKEIR